MSNIHVHIENCFGIGRLDHVFDFSQKPVVVVYAPNGMMKTSFTKTLREYAEGKSGCDAIYTSRRSCATFDDGGEPLNRESVYVVNAETYSPAAKSVTTFLASQELKRDYDAIHFELDQALKTFYGHLKTISQSSDCSVEIRAAFSDPTSEESDFEILERILVDVRSHTHIPYEFKYNDVFDKGGKIQKFLGSNRNKLQEYFEAYQRVVTTSCFFKSTNGHVFGTEQAGAVLKGLSDGTFFDVGHRVRLMDGNIVDSYAKLKEMHDGELARVVNDPLVKKAFDKIDKAIGGNQELRDFKAVLLAHNEYINELIDYEAFRRKVWWSHLSRVQPELEELVSLYLRKKNSLEEIFRRADAEQEVWRHVITVFKERFHAPFDVSIVNKRSVLFQHKDAMLQFSYQERGNPNAVVREPTDLLSNVFSRGESRAFCILQVLFEIEARKHKPLLLVFDDIADSFDYKNKYAIVEYIRDLQREPNVRSIILTHNLDFYRTIASRLGLTKGLRNTHCLFAQKDDFSREIHLGRGSFLNNLILWWIDHCDKRILLAMLPFIRNLVEFMHGGNADDFLLLTACLHNIKHRDPRLRQTQSVLVNEVLAVYLKVIPRLTGLDSQFADVSVPWVNELKVEAARIAAERSPDETLLQNKVVLAMFIRLQSEAFMDDCIKDAGHPPFVCEGVRFGKLFDEWRNMNLGDPEDASLLDRVSMMTPEQIHLNSFMYEPLVDMSLDSLLMLYNDVTRKWSSISF